MGHPQPWTPHLRRAAPCSAPGRPSTPQARRPLQPARAATRSCPARPRLRLAGAPGPDRPPPGPSGRCAPNGGGVRGASPPRGADTRKQPTSRVPARAHAGLHGGAWDSSQSGLETACVRRFSRLETCRAGHRLSLPEPKGQRQLVIVPAQRTKARRSPLPHSSSRRSFPPQCLASRSKGRPRGSAPLPAPRHKLRDWLGRSLSLSPTPSRLEVTH